MGTFCPIQSKVPIVSDQHENVLIVNPLQQKLPGELRSRIMKII